jgi:hypothetical protein
MKQPLIEIVIDDTKIELVVPDKLLSARQEGLAPNPGLSISHRTGSRNRASGLPILSIASGPGLGRRAAAAKTFGDVVDYQVSLELRSQNVTRAMLKELCATLRKGDDS